MTLSVRNTRRPLVLLLDVLAGYAMASIAVAVLAHDEGDGPSLLAVAAVVAGSVALSRGLQETALDEASLRRVGAVASAGMLFVILHLEYAATAAPWDFGWLRLLATDLSGAFEHHRGVLAGCAALIALWMRGASVGQQSLDFDRVLSIAAPGFVAVAIAVVLSPATHGPQLFGPIALIFLVLALSALALYQAPDPDVPLARFVSRWGGGLAVALGGAALLAIVAAAFDPGSLGVLEPLARPLELVIGAVARFVLGPIFATLGWLFHGILPSQNRAQEPAQQQQPVAQHQDHSRPLWQQILGFVIGGGVVALFALGLLALLWFAFRRFAKPKERLSERREALERESTIRADLGTLWGSFTRRFARTPPTATVAVQRLYFEVLATAEDGGLSRRASDTPLEFAPSLDGHFGTDAPSAISDAFSASRYGSVQFDDDDVAALRSRWQRGRAGQNERPST